MIEKCCYTCKYFRSFDNPCGKCIEENDYSKWEQNEHFISRLFGANDTATTAIRSGKLLDYDGYGLSFLWLKEGCEFGSMPPEEIIDFDKSELMFYFDKKHGIDSLKAIIASAERLLAEMESDLEKENK